MKTKPLIHVRRLSWSLLFLLVVMGLFGQRGWLDLKRMENENRRIEIQMVELVKQTQRLENEINGLSKDQQIQENTIRKDLGYIRPDEIIIEF